jgi:hypothetical protein
MVINAFVYGPDDGNKVCFAMAIFSEREDGWMSA